MTNYTISNNDQNRKDEIAKVRDEYSYVYLPEDGTRENKIVVAEAYQKRDKASFQWTAKLVLNLFS